MTVLAAAQFDPHLGDREYNLERITALLDEAARAWPPVLPEETQEGWT